MERVGVEPVGRDLTYRRGGSGGRVAVASPRPHRLESSVRYLALTCVLVGVVGLAGRWLAWPLLTSTIGPTAYLFASHPRSEPARFRNATVGHAVAIGVGVAAYAAFGLAQRPSVVPAAVPTWRQVVASAVAVGVTMSVLELLRSHHAPAAATALLVTTGLARPGDPLIGLAVGLAIVIALGPLCGRWRAQDGARARAGTAGRLPPTTTTTTTTTTDGGDP